MSGQTKIEWADKVWNPVTGCTPVSAGCANCYAKRMSKRLAGRCGYPKDNPFAVTLHPKRLDEPLHWKKPQRIFVCSMGDLFHEDVPAAFSKKIFDTIKRADQHTFIMLTKRPHQMCSDVAAYSVFYNGNNLLPNLYIGVSVEDQATADERIPHLFKLKACCPSLKIIVSYEPALGPVDFKPYLSRAVPPDHDGGTGYMTAGLDWVIMGGESGPRARPMHPDWARNARDQCKAAGVPFFFKQWGEWLPEPVGNWNEKDRVVLSDESTSMWRHNNIAKRYEPEICSRLDGKEYKELLK